MTYSKFAIPEKLNYVRNNQLQIAKRLEVVDRQMRARGKALQTAMWEALERQNQRVPSVSGREGMVRRGIDWLRRRL